MVFVVIAVRVTVSTMSITLVVLFFVLFIVSILTCQSNRWLVVVCTGVDPGIDSRFGSLGCRLKWHVSSEEKGTYVSQLTSKSIIFCYTAIKTSSPIDARWEEVPECEECFGIIGSCGWLWRFFIFDCCGVLLT